MCDQVGPIGIHIDDVDKPSAGSVDRRCPYRSVVPIGSDCV